VLEAGIFEKAMKTFGEGSLDCIQEESSCIFRRSPGGMSPSIGRPFPAEFIGGGVPEGKFLLNSFYSSWDFKGSQPGPKCSLDSGGSEDQKGRENSRKRALRTPPIVENVKESVPEGGNFLRCDKGPKTWTVRGKAELRTGD